MFLLKLVFVEILFLFDYLFIIKIINYYFKDMNRYEYVDIYVDI